MNCQAADTLINMKLILSKYLTYNKTANKAVCVYGCSIYSFWDQHKVLELGEMQASSAGINITQTGGYHAAANKNLSKYVAEKCI